MLDGPKLLILSAVPAGAAVGSALWLALNAFSAGPSAMAEISARLAAMTPPRPHPSAATSLGLLMPSLTSHPLFQTAGDGLQADAAMHLEGVSMTLGRTAALIAIGDKPAQWIRLGESLAGVTLRRVAPTTVTVESLSGEHTLTLGRNLAAPPASASHALSIQGPPGPSLAAAVP